MNDLKFAIRQLLKSPGFTVLALFTLALGIGANTTVFSVAKAVLFRRLGYDNADRLMWIRQFNTQTGVSSDPLSWREMLDIRESTHSFELVATWGASGPVWQDNDRVEEHPTLGVTMNLAELLGVRPVLGRMFMPSDHEESAAPVVLISHELWQSRFAGSPDVLGRELRLDGKLQTVVGVLPPNLQFPLARAPTLATGNIIAAGVQSFWLPFKEPRGQDLTSRGARLFSIVARLKTEVTEEMARAELATLAQRLEADYPDTNRGIRFELISFRDQILGRSKQGIPLLAIAVAAVLLICCANLANLLLARGIALRRELAVRLALGAGRARLVRSHLAETILLALVGGLGGIGIALGALHGIRVSAADSIPFIREVTIDSSVFLFTAGLSLATALIFGLLPALRQSRIAAAEALRSGARTTDGKQVRNWQEGLLVGQIAVVLVLLATAGLLLESFRRLLGQDLGYNPRSVLAVDISTWGFESNEEVCRFYRALQARLAALPGVEAVGTVSSAPLTAKWTFDEKAQIFGESLPESQRPSLAAGFVAFDYFQAMGIPLIEGRFFDDRELKDGGYGQIVILNESAASLLFPGRSAIGGRFTVGSNPDRNLEVIGVVKDTRDVRLEQRPQPRFYWQYAFGGAQVVIRSTHSLRAITPLVRDTIQKSDPRVIMQTMRPMSDVVSSTVAERRFLMTMLMAYAVLALGIATVGIGGVIAYQVAQRTNEFGIRIALGSSRGGLLRLVLSRAGRLVLGGLALGLVLCFATNRLLASQLFNISPTDPLLLGTVCLILLLIALVASILPARRAANVDPIIALRTE